MKIFNKITYHMLNYPRLIAVFFILLLSIVLFSGCGTTTVVKEKVITQVDTVEAPKPVPCKVEGLTCNFEGPQYMPTYNLLACLIIHKHVLEICAGKNKEVPFDAPADKIRDYIQKESTKIEAELLDSGK